jgi:hypothetical protein
MVIGLLSAALDVPPAGAPPPDEAPVLDEPPLLEELHAATPATSAIATKAIDAVRPYGWVLDKFIAILVS